MRGLRRRRTRWWRLTMLGYAAIARKLRGKGNRKGAEYFYLPQIPEVYAIRTQTGAAINMCCFCQRATECAAKRGENTKLCLYKLDCTRQDVPDGSGVCWHNLNEGGATA